MAGADYRGCDVCGAKAFYDANVEYDYTRLDKDNAPLPGHNTGEWVVICIECAKVYTITITKAQRVRKLKGKV